MSNRLFQGIIHQMKDAVDRVIGVLDENGIIISCSDLAKIGGTRQGVRDELSYTSETVMSGGYTYKPIGSGAKTEYIVFVEGEDKQAERLAAILSISLGSIKGLYDDKYDKASFIKNVILDNILPSDIYLKSKELHFSNDVMRIVMLIKFIGKNEIIPYQMVQNMFPDKNKDYVISVGESDIVLVKEVKPNYDTRAIEKIAQSISDTFGTEFYTKVSIGIGTAVESIKDLARSYKEAQVAIEVGKVFDTEKNIVSYENLGIGRLIYQLPTTLCEMFLSEVFKKGSIETLDRETLLTIQCFFENNLNVSETSRKLFVHRNTLVYRLEKVRKLTGLDLREFDHAITFKVAMMVKKYLTSKPVKF
ncbi:MAG: helix-turn-helix domain-containing protein [Firmicutes bacterium]|uniref:Helix-turn-helix domain-containing protein n=1 Tax=Candidatus Colimorpha enterica TaxID=3083063 RepID=R6TQL4_9BACT|nr:helix-turn-helix domain-containing protein [Candidatus Colimorpha enterica]MDD6321632.1 helix-turn-helix domain-containing protein [Bacillota bacterium]MDY2906889.1 helix-turn-helix domain-containing protein [Eubacteriales bacterium]CDC74475.1 transcriptional regulator CdaR [Candidatus Colimorpha enterica]